MIVESGIKKVRKKVPKWNEQLMSNVSRRSNMNKKRYFKYVCDNSFSEASKWKADLTTEK